MWVGEKNNSFLAHNFVKVPTEKCIKHTKKIAKEMDVVFLQRREFVHNYGKGIQQ